MSEFRWIKTSLFLILVLQFTAAATGQLLLYATVRDGDEATLPCNSVMYGSKNCDSTEWIFIDLRRTPAVVLVKDGKIVEAAKAKSDRLSVSENCSLVIKNVTDEDVGRYDCRQFRSGVQQGQDAFVYLSVVTMTEHDDNDEVTLNCSMSTYLGRCRHTVKWLLHGQDVDKDNKDFTTSQSSCSTSLKFLTSHFIYTSRFNSFKCEVTERDKVQQFSFRYSPSAEKTGWWRFIFVSVALAALIIIVVAVNMWLRIKEKKTQMDQIAVRYDEEDDTVTYENIRRPDGV